MPNVLINRVIEMRGYKSDATLARDMRMNPAYVSKVRNKQIPIGEAFLWRLHLLTGIDGKTLKEWGGME